jgi:ferritin-like protein
MHTRGLIWSAGPPAVAGMRAFGAAPEAAPPTEEPQHDTPLTGRDEAIFLLHIGAEIEHSLMVQYLYAGYSLDPTGVPKDLCEQVQAWQHSILDIAREEMGHLVTVQNLLRVLGGPLNFEREDFPFRSGFYPFHFRLEPLSRHSLAKYVVAEMPVNPQEPDIDEIKSEASTGNQGMDVNRVGILYDKVITLLENSERVPDADFESNSVGYQADFATWGRNYTRVPRPGPSPPSGPAPGARAPQLIVRPVGNRTQALAALRAVSEQGEGLADPETELSHFQRFLEIYRAFSKETRPLVRNVASNPVTTEREAEDGDTAPSLITHATSLLWAQLFNTRYRMLLDLLAHALHVEGPLQAASGPSLRGRVIAGAFAEMYHLRALSDVIMRQPLTDPPSPLRCGPPFELPYTLSLPDLATTRWRLHRDVLLSSGKIIADLRQRSDLADAKLLDSLEAEDARFLTFIADVLGSPSRA